MYKRYSKYRQHFKESSSLDLGAGTRLIGTKRKELSDKTVKRKLRRNIDKNLERLLKAEDALERQQWNRTKLKRMLANAKKTEYKELCESWLKECNKKILDIEASISQITEWIREDKFKLSNFK